MDPRRPPRHGLSHPPPPGPPPPTGTFNGDHSRGDPLHQHHAQRPPSWGPEPPSHLTSSSSSTSSYHPHPLQPGPHREHTTNPADYSPKHQRHTSHQETYHRQEWPPAPSSSYPPPHATAGNGYEKRRNSYGSTAPPHNPQDFDRGPPLATSPPSHAPRRDPYEMAHPPQAHPQQQQQQHQPLLRGDRAIMGGSPPAPYRGAHDPSSLSSAPSYAARHMPPPSASPKPYQHNPNHPPPPTSRPAPAPSPTSTYSSGRDLPSLSTITRPGSSMSISSMLGGDPPRPSDALSSRNPRATMPPSSSASPNYATMRAPSPPAGPGYSPYRGPQTPDRYPRAGPQGAREPRADPAGSQTVSPYGAADPYSHGSQKEPPPLYGSRLHQSQSPSASHARPSLTNYSRGSTPPRPDTQPPRHGGSGGRPEEASRYQQSTSGPPYDYGAWSSQTPAYEDRASLPHHRDERYEQYPASVPPSTASTATQPPAYRHEYGPNPRDARAEAQEAYSSRAGIPAHPAGHASVAPRSSSTTAPDSGYSSRAAAPPPYTDRSGRVVGDGIYRGRSPQKEYGSVGQPRFASPNQAQAADNRRPSASNASSVYGGRDAAGYAHSVDSQGRKDSDESQPPRHHTPRNLLSVGAELGRKGGRMSPLPQAVQGAQSQFSGPGGEPGIKSEFGRMFSGIGSGVGAMAAGSPLPNGMQLQTLSTSSTPVHREDVTESASASAARVGDELKAIRTGSRGGRKGRKAKPEEHRVDGESEDGRSTPGAVNGRGTKRSRHGHPHPPHHAKSHHQHPHHHHRGNDDLASTGSALGHATSGNIIRRTSTPSGLSTSTAAGQHHHHADKTTPTPARPASPYVPPRKATTTVLSQGVLDGVSRLPRHHLGSALYTPTLTVSKASRDDQFGFTTTPRPLPRFEGKENSTFTMRIPRYYLSDDNREELVRRRAVWGSEIYTDDSDVLAALVHSGWIRGAWGLDVDVSLLDLGPDDGGESPSKRRKTDSVSKTLTAPPSVGPMRPPPMHDLHVTLLILPPLVNYASTVSRGLRSRAWGDNHDGMSFKVEKIEWVGAEDVMDEARGGAARRRRIRGFLESYKDTKGAVRVSGAGAGRKKTLEEGTWAVQVVG